MRTVGIVPAAGAGARFGGSKLLTEIAGRPLLHHTVMCLLDGGVESVVVVLDSADDAAEREVPALADDRVRVVRNEHPERGMFSSIQAAAAGVEADAIVVLPGDMPYVERATVSLVIEEFSRARAIVSPRYRGKRGHPIVLPGALRDEIVAADPLSDLHSIVRAHAETRVNVDVDDRGVLRDVDTMADLHA